MLIESAMTTADPRYVITNYDAKLSRLVAPGLMSKLGGRAVAKSPAFQAKMSDGPPEGE